MDKKEKKRIKEQVIDGSIYKKKRYIQWRTRVFRRDRYECQMPGCGARGGHLQAHHIKMKYYFPELIFHVSNGITLCWKCHKEIHQDDTHKKLVRKFRKIIRDKKKVKDGKKRSKKD